MSKTTQELKEAAEMALERVEGLKGMEQITAVIDYNKAKKAYETACRRKANDGVIRSYKLRKK